MPTSLPRNDRRNAPGDGRIDATGSSGIHAVQAHAPASPAAVSPRPPSDLAVHLARRRTLGMMMALLSGHMTTGLLLLAGERGDALIPALWSHDGLLPIVHVVSGLCVLITLPILVWAHPRPPARADLCVAPGEAAIATARVSAASDALLVASKITGLLAAALMATGLTTGILRLLSDAHAARAIHGGATRCAIPLALLHCVLSWHRRHRREALRS